MRAGARRAFALSLGAFGAGASTAVVPLAFRAAPQAGLGAAATMVALLLAGRATAFFGRDGLFGVLAASSAILAIIFVSAV